MNEPQQRYLRRADVKEWLEPLGISIRQVDKLRAAGALTIVQLAGQGCHGYYVKAQIVEVILKPLREAEAGSAGVCTDTNTRKER